VVPDVTIEVTAREPDVGARLRDGFPRGMGVHVTFLPDDALDASERTCIAVARAGYDPIPHLTARNFVHRDALDAHLARLSSEAGVVRALVIAGDVARARGPFASSLDLLKTGLLQRHGIMCALIAGYPEGHPVIGEAALDGALREKVSLARSSGMRVEIITQFCFDAVPIAAWIERQRAGGIALPIRVGIAGPASVAALLKFARRCGIGNSMRALGRHGLGLANASPDGLLGDLQGRLGLDAIHVYTFGGLKTTAAWLGGPA
jgi:methylenetetrahydrofolate reductase (NADPH)